MHTGQAILDALDARFSRQHIGFGPYFFADLSGTSETDEQAAIDAGRIRATRISYAARKDPVKSGPLGRLGRCGHRRRTLCSTVSMMSSIWPLSTCLAKLSVKPLAVAAGTWEGRASA
jgi:hypothetical protein